MRAVFSVVLLVLALLSGAFTANAAESKKVGSSFFGTRKTRPVKPKETAAVKKKAALTSPEVVPTAAPLKFPEHQLFVRPPKPPGSPVELPKSAPARINIQAAASANSPQNQQNK